MLCLLLGVVLAGVLTEPQARASYSEMEAAFSNASVTYEFALRVPESYKDSIRLETEFVKSALRDPVVRERIRDAAAASGGEASLPESDDELFDHFRSMLTPALEIDRDAAYSIQRGDAWQIVRWDPMSSHDATPEDRRMEQVLQRGITLDQIEFSPSAWICLEPGMTQGVPTAWYKSTIQFSGLVPPFFSDGSISTITKVSFEELWKVPSEVSSASVRLESGDQSLFVYREWGNGFLVACYSNRVNGGCFPGWVAECFTYDPENMTFTRGLASETPPTNEELLSATEAVAAITEGKTFSASKGILPRNILSFVDFFDVASGYRFPQSIQYYEVGRVRTSEAPLVNAENRPFGQLAYSEVRIQDLKIGDQVPKLKPLELPMPISILNRDSEEGFMLGSSKGRPIVKTKSQVLLIVINLIVLIIASVWLVFRRAPNSC